MPNSNPAVRWLKSLFRQARCPKRVAPARLLRGESLEDRRLLAGVYGWNWDDVDWNAQWDESETAQPGRLVYVDDNQNGMLDTGENALWQRGNANHRRRGSWTRQFHPT